jgi:hypothetical protein
MKAQEASLGSALVPGQKAIAEARLAAGFKDFKRGRYRTAWPNYEHRWLALGKQEPQYPRRWRGESLEGLTLFIDREQGLGDEILFASCFEDAIASARQCHITCDLRLAPICRRSFPTASFIPEPNVFIAKKSAPMPTADYQISAGNVPQYFRGGITDFPSRRSFLTADVERVRVWRERFGALGGKVNVGVAWQGGKDAEALRHAPWEFWHRLFAVERVNFVNLQYGGASAIRVFRRSWGAVVREWDDVDLLMDIDELAAMIAALDVVITVTNSVAHLAGALGANVWILLAPKWGAWWILDAGPTPWYPSSVVYTKGKTLKGWEALSEEIVRDLEALRDDSSSEFSSRKR